MNSELKYNIKKECPFLNMSDITLILKFLQQSKPHLQIPNDHRINSRTLNTFEMFFSSDQPLLKTNFTQTYEIQCLQMAVFDQILGAKKIIEVFSVDQFQQELSSFINHVELCKSLIKTDLTLQVLDSYYLDDLNSNNDDEKLYYAIEYEYFDYSNRDILGNTCNISIKGEFSYFNQLNQNQKDQKQIELDNYLYSIFKYCQSILCPQKKIQQLIEESFIRNLAYIVFQQQAEDQSEIIKLNPVDSYLFERDLVITHISKKINQNKQAWPTRYIKQKNQIQIEKDNLIQQFKNEYPQLYDQFSEILLHISTNNPQFTTYLVKTFSQKPNKILTLKATNESQHTQFKIIKFTSIEEAQAKIDEISQKIMQLNSIQIQSNIKKLNIISNQQGMFIVQEIDLSLLFQMNNLQDIKENYFILEFSLPELQKFQKYLLQVEICSKLIIWVVTNIQTILQYQINPQNLYISLDGQIFSNELIERSSQKSKNQIEFLFTKYNDIIFGMQGNLTYMFGETSFSETKTSQKKVENLMKNYFSSIDFVEKKDCKKTQQEILDFFNRLLYLKQQNEKFQKVNLSISSNSLENFTFYNNIWSCIEDTIQIMKENKNIIQIQNKLLPSDLNFEFQNTLNFNKGENISDQLLFEQIGNIIENYQKKNQSFTEQQISKIKELIFQEIDKFYDLSNLKLKPFQQQFQQTDCNFCLTYSQDFNRYLILKTFKYCNLIVIQEKLSQESQNIQEQCATSQIIQFQNTLIKDHHNLKKIQYQLCDCEIISQALKEQVDFFGLKNKKQLQHLIISIYEQQVSDIYKQLKQNKSNVNTLEVTINIQNFFRRNRKGKFQLKKIPYLVEVY